MKKFPVFLCEPIDAIHWQFWCPFCKRHHWHGAGPGHRVAHCGPTTPLRDGYILKLDPRFAKKWKLLRPIQEKYIRLYEQRRYREAEALISNRVEKNR